MMRFLFILAMFPIVSFAQVEDTTIYEFPDIEAQYPGGVGALHQFIIENIEYPDCQYEPETSKFFFSFIVEIDGTMTNLRLERPKNMEIDQTFQDFFDKMPNWIPATVNWKRFDPDADCPLSFVCNNQ